MFLLLTISVPIFAILPNVNAHDPSWNMPTYTYISAAPNPIGVGQTAIVVFWVDKLPPTAAGHAGDRWFFYVDVTKPDETKETVGPFTSDPVGGSYYSLTPQETGTYTFTARFGPQVITGSNGTGVYNYNIAINDTYLASSATTTLTVQDEPIPEPVNYPLPTEYWTRPIEGQNVQWYTIASNWLGSPQIAGKYQPGGSAPNSGPDNVDSTLCVRRRSRRRPIPNRHRRHNILRWNCIRSRIRQSANYFWKTLLPSNIEQLQNWFRIHMCRSNYRRNDLVAELHSRSVIRSTLRL